MMKKGAKISLSHFGENPDKAKRDKNAQNSVHFEVKW